MCGRFHNHLKNMNDLVDILNDWPANIPTRFNVAPTTTAPIVTSAGTLGARWGLIPSWAKEFKSQYATFNARIESAHEKPTFRSSWKDSRTCIIPMAGYYEWKNENGSKQPYYIHDSDSLLLTAGLWEHWEDKSTGELKTSFTMLTEDAQGDLKDLHHRMPVFLENSQVGDWLNTGTSSVLTNSVYKNCEYYLVRKDVNNVRNEGEHLIEPL